MRHSIRLAALGLLLPLCTAAQSPAASPCPYAADYLKTQLGQPFKAGVPENGLIGKGCTYSTGAIKLWVDAGPPPIPGDRFRRMSSPPGTSWQAVPGDPDHAVHETPPASVSPYPSLSYEHQGWLVKLTVTGVSGKAAIDDWNARLLKLPRIP